MQHKSQDCAGSLPSSKLQVSFFCYTPLSAAVQGFCLSEPGLLKDSLGLFTVSHSSAAQTLKTQRSWMQRSVCKPWRLRYGVRWIWDHVQAQCGTLGRSFNTPTFLFKLNNHSCLPWPYGGIEARNSRERLSADSEHSGRPRGAQAGGSHDSVSPLTIIPSPPGSGFLLPSKLNPARPFLSKLFQMSPLVFFSFNVLCLYLGDIFFLPSTGTVTRIGAKITTGPLARPPKSEKIVWLGDS